MADASSCISIRGSQDEETYQDTRREEATVMQCTRAMNLIEQRDEARATCPPPMSSG